MDLIYRHSPWYPGTEHENLWLSKDFAIKYPAVCCLVEPALGISLSSLLVRVKCQTWLEFCFGTESFKGIWHTHHISIWSTSSWTAETILILNCWFVFSSLPSVHLFYRKHLLLFNDQLIFFRHVMCCISALFTEICHFSDTVLLSSSWRTSLCVWNLSTGERTLQNFWLLKSWVLKGKTAPWRTCPW